VNKDTTVGISREARQALEQYLSRRQNPTIRDFVSELVTRFLSKPDPLKSIELGHVDRGMEEVYAAWLESMAHDLRERARGEHIPEGEREGRHGNGGGDPTKPPAPAPGRKRDARQS
jgi:hypothetical protein